MPTVKEYNVRIARLRNTRKMTKTMKMVSANKLRKAQEALKHAGLFDSRLQHLAGALPPAGDARHPLEERRACSGNLLALVITSDRGLCGGFNNNLNRAVLEWAEQRRAAGQKVFLSFFGRRGYLYLRRRLPVRKCYEGDSAKPAFESVRKIASDLQGVFLGGRYDEVYVAYNRFRSALSQTPSIERFLPLEMPASAGRGDERILTPGPAELRDAMVGQIVALKLYCAVRNSAVGEQGARMTAMDNSTTNAENLILSYTLRRNRARQAAITRELIEIVAGAEALA